jgi:hypothetical protein
MLLINIKGDDLPLEDEENKISILLFPPVDNNVVSQDSLSKQKYTDFFKYIFKFVVIFLFLSQLLNNNKLINLILPNMNSYVKLTIKTTLLLGILSIIDKK